MEEHVGALWHRLITRAARTGYPHAAVPLASVARTVGVMFRALGGDGGLRVEVTQGTDYQARRGWLQRVAGTGTQVELAWRDEQALRLPAVIDHFASESLNRDLYLWLAALAAGETGPRRPWIQENQHLTRLAMEQFPGLTARYRRLVAAELNERPLPESLPPDEAAQEAAIRTALEEPGSIRHLPPASRPPHPVCLWLHPSPPHFGLERGTRGADDDPESNEGRSHDGRDGRRRNAERTESPERKGGLMGIRWDVILGWGEFARVDRETDDEDDPEQASRLADDLDVLSVARDRRATASRVRFDLDLPSAADDDVPLSDGILLPEWDFRKGVLRPEHCRLQPLIAATAEPCDLPDRLRRTAGRLRSQFQALAPSRVWHRAQPEGSEIDLDACERFITQRATGRADADGNLYRDMRVGGRDLACLLLADLSLSTDAWVNNDARVIDVIRDSLFLFAEALSATGDRFGLFGFSSRRRDHVRFHHIKEFSERHSGTVRGRIAVLKPGYYTRMGAAIRRSTALLAEQAASRRLLLILTDGKPNDLDQYEGRYGIEDTRAAVAEARRAGLRPFCVTIDDRAGDYLPHLFGSDGFVVIRRPSELPRRLPLLYAQLTA